MDDGAGSAGSLPGGAAGFAGDPVADLVGDTDVLNGAAPDEVSADPDAVNADPEAAARAASADPAAAARVATDAGTIVADVTDVTDVTPAVEDVRVVPTTNVSVSRAIADAFAAAGARFAFTVPGESFLPLLDDLPAAGVRVVTARHEGGASFMAEAAAQLTGRPQLVLATRTVGAANAAIGLHTARADSVPLVALVGQVRRVNRGREAFQESELGTGIGSLAKWSAELGEPSDISRTVGEGLRQLTTGRPGPILLAVPEDVLDEYLSAPIAPPATVGQGPAADRAAVRKILRWLAASRRGVILAGTGVLRARASRRLVTLSEALAIPVITSWRHADAFPNDHPNYLGMSGYWAPPTVRQRLLDADVLLVLGSRLSEVTTFGYRVPAPSTRWAHVDLEPRVAHAGLAAPALAVAADVSRFLDAAWADLRGVVLDAQTRGARAAATETDRAAYLAASSVDGGAWAGPGVHPGRVVATLQALLPANAILTTDAGNFAGWIARGYRFRRPGTFLGPTSGAMGYGLPAAIAASLVHPDRVSVAVCGDGGLAMTMSELETAVREGARPIVLVFDNQQYGTIAMHQARGSRSGATATLGPVDFAAVATACGALGIRVDEDAAFEPALRVALSASRPTVIHLPLDRRWVSVNDTPGGPAVA